MKRTQNKENYYYLFWIVVWLRSIGTQVYTTIALDLLTSLRDPIELGW